MLNFIANLIQREKPVPAVPPPPARIAVPVFDVTWAEEPFDERDRMELRRFLTGTLTGRKLRYEILLRIHERRSIHQKDLRAHDLDFGYASACLDILDFATVTRNHHPEEEGSSHHE